MEFCPTSIFRFESWTSSRIPTTILCLPLQNSSLKLSEITFIYLKFVFRLNRTVLHKLLHFSVNLLVLHYDDLPWYLTLLLALHPKLVFCFTPGICLFYLTTSANQNWNPSGTQILRSCVNWAFKYFFLWRASTKDHLIVWRPFLNGQSAGTSPSPDGCFAIPFQLKPFWLFSGACLGSSSFCKVFLPILIRLL